MIGELVTHDSHDVVSVSDETHDENDGQDCDLPSSDWKFGFGDISRVPGCVNYGPRSDCVSNIVGTMSERGGTAENEKDWKGKRETSQRREFARET